MTCSQADGCPRERQTRSECVLSGTPFKHLLPERDTLSELAKLKITMQCTPRSSESRADVRSDGGHLSSIRLVLAT